MPPTTTSSSTFSYLISPPLSLPYQEGRVENKRQQKQASLPPSLRLAAFLESSMGVRLGFIFLLLAFAMVVEPFSFRDEPWDETHIQVVDGTQVNASDGFGTFGGAVGELIDEEEEMMMDSEINRRTLAQGTRHISYGALQRDQVPCSRRGSSYYNCGSGRQANPYRRGCSVITKCNRYTG